MPGLSISGWMHEAEREALRRWAFGLDVLEMGCFKGLSTSQLLATANSVHAVDTFDALGTAHHGEDTQDEFYKNMVATGNSGKLATAKGRFDEVLPKMRADGRSYDFVFIDGSHDVASVRQDIELALPLIRPGGAIGFHDYGTANPGVVEAVDEFLAKGGWHCEDQAKTAILLRQGQEPAPKKVYGYGLYPNRGDNWVHLVSAWAMDSKFSRKYNRSIKPYGVSVLTQNFNTLLCNAFNDQKDWGGKITHLAMLHNDMAPEDYWFDTLVDEMEAKNLDILAAVVPFKNERGVTSTGLYDPAYEWGIRRLTMTEVFRLPETFTKYDIPGRPLNGEILLNTGCWVMRFDRPWVKGLHFRQTDSIITNKVTGEFMPASLSEDWDWSQQLVSRGCRIGATRKVKLYHDKPIFHNQSVWGTWDKDYEYLEHVAAARAYHAKQEAA